MEKISVWYIFKFDINSWSFKDKRSFLSLLKINPDLNVTSKNIKYNWNKYQIDIDINIIEEKKISIFHFNISSNKLTDDFIKLNKILKELIKWHIKWEIYKIWDWIWLEYSKKLYPMIYELENLMRLLIIKFNVYTIWNEYIKKTTPLIVKEKIIKKKNNLIDSKFIYESDFIHLSEYLFEEYANKNTWWLIELLKKEKKNDFKWLKNVIDDYLPKNNWDRYFWKIISIDSKSFGDKWWKMYYDFRNLIAHNKWINKNDYEEGKKLWKELINILKKSIDNISKVEIKESDKENIYDFNEHIDNTYNKINEISYKIPTLTDIVSKNTTNSIYSLTNNLNIWLDYKVPTFTDIINKNTINSIYSLNEHINNRYNKINEISYKVPTLTDSLSLWTTNNISKLTWNLKMWLIDRITTLWDSVNVWTWLQSLIPNIPKICKRCWNIYTSWENYIFIDKWLCDNCSSK